MVKHFAAALLFLAASTGGALADCASPATDKERAQCMGEGLRQSDQVINDEYKAVRGLLDDKGRAQLQHEELGWIARRAKSCAIDTKEPDREKWMAALITNYSKTVCVVRFTEQRIDTLKAEHATLAAAPAGAPPAELPAAAPAAAGSDVYELTSHGGETTGHYYFEVTLDKGQIANIAETSLFVGIESTDTGSTGTLVAIRKHDAGSMPVVIGVAADLKQGMVYIRTDGSWDSEPGSTGGTDFKLGRPYQGFVSSTVSLSPLLDRKLIDVNMGQHPFVYALPNGYVPLDRSGPIPGTDP